jgi:hypothetical protein
MDKYRSMNAQTIRIEFNQDWPNDQKNKAIHDRLSTETPFELVEMAVIDDEETRMAWTGGKYQMLFATRAEVTIRKGA